MKDDTPILNLLIGVITLLIAKECATSFLAHFSGNTFVLNFHHLF